MNVWVRFALAQLVMLFFWFVGIFVLIIPCVAMAWERSPTPSLNDGRPIDRWKWPWLTWLGYHNVEDGDSGQTALVWRNGQQVVYADPKWPRWSAYKWSALRNSADGWKYRFAYANGQLVRFQFLGLTIKAGYQLENGFNVPVLSL